MATIRARCPSCGIVEMALSVISLNLDARTYSFTCPGCWAEITRTASHSTLTLLAAAGAPSSGSDPLAEDDLAPSGERLPFDDWSPDPNAPPFTTNDLIDFHYLLQQDAELTLLRER